MILPASPPVSDDSTVPALTSATYSYWVSIKTAVFMNLLLFTFLFFRICEGTAAKTAPRSTQMFLRRGQEVSAGFENITAHVKEKEI